MSLKKLLQITYDDKHLMSSQSSVFRATF